MTQDQYSGHLAPGLQYKFRASLRTRSCLKLTHTCGSLLLAAESTLNCYASLTPGLFPPHTSISVFWPSSNHFYNQTALNVGVCVWILSEDKSPSKETSIKTNSYLLPYLYSRGRDAQQNGLPEWICLVIINLGISRSGRAHCSAWKPVTWSSAPRTTSSIPLLTHE